MTKFKQTLLLEDYEFVDSEQHPVFGKINIYRSKEASEFIFCKTTKDSGDHLLNEFIREIELRLSINNPNFLKLLDYSITPVEGEQNSFLIQTFYEYPRMNLNDIYKEFQKKVYWFTDEDLFKLGMDILKALKCLKENHIVHGDLRQDYIA